jgi:uncharacterized small protein (DUF1192 family)
MASQETSEERRTYKRLWQRQKRAEEREEKGPVRSSDRAAPFLQKRIAAMETELATLKAETVGPNLNLPDVDSGADVPSLENAISGLFAYQSIKELSLRVADLENKYERLRQQGEWPNRLNDLRQLNMHKARVNQMEQQAAELEKQIEWRSPPNGKLWLQMFGTIGLINTDRGVVQAMMSSPNSEEQRRASLRAQDLDRKEGAWNTELATLKSKLVALRG